MQSKGRLKIFFGYCAGVGKTYSMLKEAHEKAQEGVDVVIGYIEPHDRKETMALIDGLEQLDKKEILYKKHRFFELDLDSALKRRPKLILVDELAHTNAIGSRHKKRYSDIEELLRAGIDVYTTLNVQHLESLHDTVAMITRIQVNERIPDHIFDDADDVKLVDIEVDDLIQRLKEGKIYHKNQTKRALENFFVRDNLIALREIAMRRCADRINLVTATANKAFSKEHIMVCLGASPTNQKVIRTAARMVQAFHADFTALYVETSQADWITQKAKNQLQANLELARHLRADIVSTYGDDIAYQISQYAKNAHVSKLVLGRSYQKPSLFRKTTLVDQLSKLAPEIEIYIIPDQQSGATKRKYSTILKSKFNMQEAVITAAVLFVTTLLALFLDSFHVHITSIVLLYVLASCFIGMMTFYPLYNLIATFLSLLLIDIFFVDPRFSLMMDSKEYPIMFFVMMVVSLSISMMGHRLKKEKMLASLHAHSMEVILQTSQRLQVLNTYHEIMEEACYQLFQLLHRPIIFYPVEHQEMKEGVLYKACDFPAIKEQLTCIEETAVARWVFTNNKNAGATTNTLSHSKALYLAIRKGSCVYGVVGIMINASNDLLPFEKNLLKAILNETALAMSSIA